MNGLLPIVRWLRHPFYCCRAKLKYLAQKLDCFKYAKAADGPANDWLAGLSAALGAAMDLLFCEALTDVDGGTIVCHTAEAEKVNTGGQHLYINGIGITSIGLHLA